MKRRGSSFLAGKGITKIGGADILYHWYSLLDRPRTFLGIQKWLLRRTSVESCHITAETEGLETFRLKGMNDLEISRVAVSGQLFLYTDLQCMKSLQKLGRKRGNPVNNKTGQWAI
jgi:hypothetical protein